MEATRPSADLPHYLGVFRRHWWVVLAATAAGLAVGATVTQATPKVYESTASVLVAPVDQDVNASGGRTKGTINLDTEAQLVVSGAVATKAATLLRSTTSPLELAHDVTVEVPPNTTVLQISYSADNAKDAQAGSHAFAEAYLRNREETARASLDTQIKTLSTKIKQLTTGLTSINSRLSKARSGSSERSNLESLRSNQQNQLNGLTGRLNALTTSTVTAGQIISDAREPEDPISPNGPLNIAAGAMIGLLVGLLLAFLRERFDRRLRTAADVRDRGRIPVLAALDERTTPHFDDVLQPYGPGGRVFNRLRNEILASLNAGDQIIVVTGASRGSSTTLVAANLAAALARTGSDVILVGAHLPDSVVDAAPLARMLGVSAMPGLSDLLAGRVGLNDVVQRTPRIPSLRVVTTGGAATAAGLMQSQRLRDTLDALRRQAGYVVIEAPSTSSSADAQSLASLADAAILAVELRRAKRPALLDAAEQLSRVGTPLLGAVVLPQLSGVTRSAAEENLPAVALGAPGSGSGSGASGSGTAGSAASGSGGLGLGASGSGLGGSSAAGVGVAAGKLDIPGGHDSERTQPMRTVGSLSPRPPRQGDGPEEVTAIIDITGTKPSPATAKQLQDDDK